MTNKLIAGLLITVIVLPATAPPLAAQGSCEASVLQRMERETRQFGEDVHDQGMEFVKTEMGEAVIEATRDLTKDSPTAQAVIDLRSKYQDWLKFREHVEIGARVIKDLEDCRAGGFSVSCLLAVAKRQNEEISKWLQSLAREDVQKIAERVTKAGGIIKSFTERAFGTGQNGIDNYLQNCTAILEQRAQTNTGNGSSNAARGGSAAKTGLLIATLAGAGGALWYGKKTLDENEAFLEEFGNINTPTSSPVPSNNPTTPAPTTGVRAFDGTYDFYIVITGPGGTNTERAFSQYLIINNGSLTTTFRDINGSVSSSGVLVNVVGSCPINPDPADFTGTISSNGTGSGEYRCRTGGISRTWRANNRR